MPERWLCCLITRRKMRGGTSKADGSTAARACSIAARERLSLSSELMHAIISAAPNDVSKSQRLKAQWQPIDPKFQIGKMQEADTGEILQQIPINQKAA